MSHIFCYDLLKVVKFSPKFAIHEVIKFKI